MKRILALILALTMLLCACGKKPSAPADDTIGVETVGEEAPAVQQTQPEAEATEAPTTEPTTEPTTAPTEAPEVFRNPINGQILSEPFTGRVFAHSVSNMVEDLPHIGVNQADILIETYVNMNNVVRCLALFSDIESVEIIASTRSTRPIFNDIAQHYDLILTHAGGSETALNDAADRGIANYNLGTWELMSAGASYRDEAMKRPYVNSLFGVGAGIKAYAEAQGVPMTLEKDYGLDFTEDGTPVAGEDAQEISILMTYKQAKKETIMVYDAALDKYVYNQYGQVMKDDVTEEPEAFTNVIVMFADITHNGIYHAADFVAGGLGYYANGGKIIPIVWGCEDEDSAFHFMTNDAQDLQLGVGNTYIAIVTPDSPVTYGESPVEETTGE